MKEQEASKKAQEMIEVRRKVWCPILQAWCVTACECYNMPEVMRNPQLTEQELLTDDGFYVYGGFCTCHALKGASE